MQSSSLASRRGQKTEATYVEILWFLNYRNSHKNKYCMPFLPLWQVLPYLWSALGNRRRHFPWRNHPTTVTWARISSKTLLYFSSLSNNWSFLRLFIFTKTQRMDLVNEKRVRQVGLWKLKKLKAYIWCIETCCTSYSQMCWDYAYRQHKSSRHILPYELA